MAAATLYRRFQDKNALLPALYERYGQQLSRWGKALWDEDQRRRHTSVEERVTHVVREHVNFYPDHEPILRTLYLYLRLHPDIELGESATRRQASYEETLTPILDALGQQGQELPDNARIKLFCLVLITSINERALFPTMIPARILELSDEEFVRELSRNLVGYLVLNRKWAAAGWFLRRQPFLPIVPTLKRKMAKRPTLSGQARAGR